MCAIDDCEPFDFYREERRRARKTWQCGECAQPIRPGTVYLHMAGIYDSRWSQDRRCLHCEAAGTWLSVVCGGWPTGQLLEELTDHWHEGYRSLPFARLIVGVKRRWHDGRDPIPEGVAELAQKMMAEKVAA